MTVKQLLMCQLVNWSPTGAFDITDKIVIGKNNIIYLVNSSQPTFLFTTEHSSCIQIYPRGMKVRDRNPNDSSINNNYHKHLIIFCFGLKSFMYSFPAIMTHFLCIYFFNKS